MKNIIVISLLTIVSISLKAQYPIELPGDNDNELLLPTDSIVEFTGLTSGIVRHCGDDLVSNLIFTFPSRALYDNDDNYTAMWYKVYKYNYITATSSIAFDGISARFIEHDDTITYRIIEYDMDARGDNITLEPFHRYHVEIITARAKKNLLGSINVRPLFPKYRTKNTQSFNYGGCFNPCNTGSLILGVLNSSPANQLAGLYHPKFESDGSIVSTTPLALDEQLILDAADYIELLPGFYAEYGSYCSVYIDGCDGAMRPGIAPEENKGEKNELLRNSLIEDINIYPNPSNGNINIDFTPENSVGDTHHIQIYDLSGKIVYSFSSNDRHMNISISNQPKGIYLIRIIDGETSIIKKLVYN